ncbi:hypothetical protein FRC03_004669 [Tulasnella sp. 419]|nr:hypothetical protein FRC03_004669 [Tulasnella sp. 419]
MPPAKRSSTASPIKLSKKARLQQSNEGQKKLDSFFKSPTKASGSSGTKETKATPEIEEIIEIIDVDEEDEPVTTQPKVEDERKLVNADGNSSIANVPSEAGAGGANLSLSSPSKPRPKQVYGIKNTAESATTTVIPDYPDIAQDCLLLSVDNCPWQYAKSAPYSFLTHAFVSLSQTRSRILLVNIMTNTLRFLIKHDPQSLLPALYLLSNSLTPPYSPLELNIGPSIITKALQSVSGLSSAALRKLYTSLGDPGDVAFEAKSSVRTLIPHPPLLITGVYTSLMKIATSKGNGAAKQKQAIVEKLLVAARGEEARYLVRTFAQHLRVGAVRTTMLTALARALVLTRPPQPCPKPPQGSPYHAEAEVLAQVQPLPVKKNKGYADEARDAIKELFLNAEGLLKKVYVQHPDYGHMVEAILSFGLENLQETVPLTVGIPLHPTLGSPTRSLDEIYERLGELAFTAEFKYDGQRAQVHASRSDNGDIKVKLFSRHLEDMTEKYPDVTALVQLIFKQSPDIESFIIDSEIVAIDASSGNVKSFQELSNRPRKDVNLQDVKVAVCLYVFDLMYFNAQILLEEPFRGRRSLLRTMFPPLVPEDRWTARLRHVESCEGEDGREAIEEFFQKSVEEKSEGLMIKLLDSGEVLEEEDGSTVVVPADTGNVAQKKGKGKARKSLPATYEPDKRTSAWLKLKKDYVNGLGDSFDLVPVGAWHGNGRKAKWWSPVLLAIWDSGSDSLVAVCKCMSGFTDAFYQAMAERYQVGSETCSKQPFKKVNCDFGGLIPSVFFKPSEVWELRGADITLSPRSTAALGLISDKRGLSIRFPRFIRIRDDKYKVPSLGRI